MGRMRDDDLPAFLADLGVPGLFDTHVHFMPDRMQAAVWAHFDELDPPWPIIYRLPEDERLALLRRPGVAPVRRLLERHPGLRLIVAHLGIPHTAEFLDLAAGHPELRLDTAMALTGSARIGGAPPAWLGDRLAGLPGQVLFGSDFASIP